MKKFKSILFGLTCMAAVVGAFAFKTEQAPVKKHTDKSFFKLDDEGVRTEITDWVLAEPGSCPGTHTDVVCRIEATLSGENPDPTEFAAILYNSSNFETDAENVSYVPEP